PPRPPLSTLFPYTTLFRSLGTVSLANAGVQDAQVIVDLGDGADRRARVATGCLLLNADRRRQAGKVIDVRLLHLAHELPRIRRRSEEHTSELQSRFDHVCR